MNYNDYIEDEKRLLSDLSYLFDLTIDGNTTKLVQVKVKQPENSYVECLIKSISYNYEIELIIEVINGPDKGYTHSVVINIPKMSSKGFIIVNKFGISKWRAGITVGKINKVIELWNNKIESNHGIIDLNEFPYDDGTFHYSTYSFTQDGVRYIYELYPYLKFLGMSEDIIEKYITKNPHEPQEYVLRKFDGIHGERFSNKFLQLTKRELRDKENLSGEDIIELIKLSKEKPESFKKFSPFDVSFINQYSSIMTELKLNSYRIMKQMTWNFHKTKRFNGSYITKIISKIFSLQAKSYETIQTGSDSNAGSFLSQSKKIYFYRGDNKTEVEYTPDFYGVICPMKTPESVSLVNVKNELARNVEVEDEKLIITLRDKSLKEVKISYADYYKSKVLSSDNYDYENNLVIPKNGKITYLFLGEFTTEDYVSDSQFDYIRCSDSDTLAYNTALIPKMNMNDSVRISMDTNMMDQAIPTIGSRPPIIATGVEREVYNKSDMTYKSPVNGKVVGVIDNFIKIRDDETNEDVIITTPPNQQTISHTYNIYKPTVKAGDKVKKGQVILSSNSFKDEQLALCNPLVVAYTDYKLGTEEDGLVITEKASQLLSHEMERIMTIEIPTRLRCIFKKDSVISELESNTKIQNKVISGIKRLNSFCLPSIGDSFKTGDIVCSYLQEQDPETNRYAYYRKIHGKEQKFDAIIKTLPYGMKYGEVIDVQIACHPGITEDGIPELRSYYEEEFNNNTRKISEFLDKAIVRRKEITPDKDFRVKVYIKFRYLLPAVVGDKLTNRFGSKGTVTKIIPDEIAPRIGGPDGQVIDIFAPPKARFNRKNPATDVESVLGLASKLAYEKGEKLLKENKFGEYINMLNLIHVTDEWINKTEEELVNYHNSQKDYYQLIVTALDKKYNKNKVYEICSYFNINVDEGDYIYFPEWDEYSENKVVTGISNFLRLHFIPSDKLSATSELYTGDELILGNGKFRGGGQKIGEMEGWALQSHGMMDIIDELTGQSYTKKVKPKLDVNYLFLGLVMSKDINPQ